MRGTKRSMMAAAGLACAFVLAPVAGAQATVMSPLAAQPDPRPTKPADFLDKAEYAPGEAINVTLGSTYNCATTVTSPGFAAPIELRQVPTAWIGEGQAAATPGAYQATFYCKYVILVDSFTIKAPVTTTTPPVTTTTPASPVTQAPKPPVQKPKPPIKKPKGAPDTGGGGTA